MKILIFGNGYLGNRCLKTWGDEAIMSTVHVKTKNDALAEIQKHNPDVVLNTAGVKGSPNVDWCEDHQMETIQGNTIMPLLLAEACQEAGIYMLHIGSGCVFYGKSDHEDGAWREDDIGNPRATYSRTKWAADLCLSTLPNVGIARIRMPLDHVPAPGNLINKIASYPKVIDVQNSATVVEDMVNVLHQLLEKRAEGIFHVTNPGVIGHKEILALYDEYVDPSHSCEFISEDELVSQGIVKKKRSTNTLASTRLEEYGITMRSIKEAVEEMMKKYGELYNAQN